MTAQSASSYVWSTSSKLFSAISKPVAALLTPARSRTRWIAHPADGEITFEEFQSWWTRYEQQISSIKMSSTSRNRWMNAGQKVTVRRFEQTTAQDQSKQGGGGDQDANTAVSTQLSASDSYGGADT